MLVLEEYKQESGKKSEF